MHSPDSILLALRDVYDPTLALNLVDLGFIDAVTLTDDAEAPGAGIAGVAARQRLTVTLLSTPEAPEADAQRLALTHNRLAGLESLSKIDVALAPDAAWTPTRIPAALRERLHLGPQPFPILNNRR